MTHDQIKAEAERRYPVSDEMSRLTRGLIVGRRAVFIDAATWALDQQAKEPNDQLIVEKIADDVPLYIDCEGSLQYSAFVSMLNEKFVITRRELPGKE